jgi:hypothetical protein
MVMSASPSRCSLASWRPRDLDGVTPKLVRCMCILFLGEAVARCAAMLAAIGATFLVFKAGEPT